MYSSLLPLWSLPSQQNEEFLPFRLMINCTDGPRCIQTTSVCCTWTERMWGSERSRKWKKERRAPTLRQLNRSPLTSHPYTHIKGNAHRISRWSAAETFHFHFSHMYKNTHTHRAFSAIGSSLRIEQSLSLRSCSNLMHWEVLITGT